MKIKNSVFTDEFIIPLANRIDPISIMMKPYIMLLILPVLSENKPTDIHTIGLRYCW